MAVAIEDETFGIRKTGGDRCRSSASWRDSQKIAFVRFVNVPDRRAGAKGEKGHGQKAGGEQRTQKKLLHHGVLVRSVQCPEHRALVNIGMLET